MARPRKPINPGQVEKLAKLGCSQAEIGSVLGCSPDTLHRRFAGALKKGNAELDISLRKKQIDVALKGRNPTTMLIWLGKQRLGQRNEPTSTSQDDQLDEIIKNQRRQYELDLARLGKKPGSNSGSGDDT